MYELSDCAKQDCEILKKVFPDGASREDVEILYINY